MLTVKSSKKALNAARLLVIGFLWLAVFPVPHTAAQTPIPAPKVFVAAAAQAFLAAMAATRPSSTVPEKADIVVLILDTKPFVHLVIVDMAGSKKYWGILTLEEVARIIGQLGSEA